MKLLFVVVNIFFVICIKPTLGISCRNEDNRDVDWFVSYKLPKLDGFNDLIESGEAYTTINPSTDTKWKLSSKKISSDTSHLGNTLSNFYNRKKDVSYIFYNDEPPESFEGTSVGHLKGVVAFDANTGFWLIHSIPAFPDPNAYKYPDSGLLNGQSILCVTFKTSTLNDIAVQLKYNHPNIYVKGLTSDVRSMLDRDGLNIFSKKPRFIRRAPFERISTMNSEYGREFVSFAKDNQFNDDLYSAIIAPRLKSSLFVETWRRGSGTISPPECQSPYTVTDVLSLDLQVVEKRKRKKIAFAYTSDHSKWAISDETSNSWVCIGDINRMESQKKRGGGSMCFRSPEVWEAFYSGIVDTTDCEINTVEK